MNQLAVFGLSALMSLLAWTSVARLYVWPALRKLPRRRALLALAVPHVFRFIGLSFLVPGVVSPGLPAVFAKSDAYGDLAAAVLALAMILVLSKSMRWGIPLAWLMNVEGTADLLHAIYQGNALRIAPGMLGAAFYLPTALVPGLLVAHFLAFSFLVRPEQDDEQRSFERTRKETRDDTLGAPRSRAAAMKLGNAPPSRLNDV